MAIDTVKIVRGQGALGRSSPGMDFYSGLIFFSDTLPSGFTTTTNIQQVLSLAAAEALGILGDSSDATAGHGTITLSGSVTTGDVITATFLMPNGTTLILGTYTLLSTDTTVTLAAVGLKNAINALTNSTGFSATNSSGVVTVIYPKVLGIYPNTGTPLGKTIVGTTVGTAAQNVVSGVASIMSQFHYHISEYYRLNSNGNLTVGIFPITANAWDLAEVSKMQSFALGKLRQIGVYAGNVTHWAAAADVATMCNLAFTQKSNMDAIHAPLNILLTCDLSAVSDFTTLTDLSTLNDYGISYSIGQDGSGVGFGIYKARGKSIGDVGAQLGALSNVAVNQDQGCLDYVNFTNGVELSLPCYCNGVQVDLVNAKALANQLDLYRYKFLMQNIGVSGVTINDNHCAITFASDYAYENDNRTFDKVHRLLYAQFIPLLKSTINLNIDGTLTNAAIAFYQAQITDALSSMTTRNPATNNQELAGFTATIDPSQNVLSTGNLVIAVKLTPEGVARNIIIGVSM